MQAGHSLRKLSVSAGISTGVARTDPDAVIAAYPDAEITGTPGVDGTLADWLLGIEVKWT